MGLNTCGRTKPEWWGSAHEAPPWCPWWWQHPASCLLLLPAKNQLFVWVEIIYFKQLYSFHFHYILENCNAVRGKKKIHVKPFSVWGYVTFSYFQTLVWLWFLSLKIFMDFLKLKIDFSNERGRKNKKNTWTLVLYVKRICVNKMHNLICFNYAEFCKKAGFINEKMLLKVKSILKVKQGRVGVQGHKIPISGSAIKYHNLML